MTHPLTYKPIKDARVISEVTAAYQHPEDVLEWRRSQFRTFGFVDYSADLLAGTRIDLHDMEDLLKAGCSHDLAMSILIGTTWHGDDPAWIEKESYESDQHESPERESDESVSEPAKA